jgi:TonB family protein
MTRHTRLFVAACAALVACRSGPPPEQAGAAPPEEEAPVAVNPQAPIHYPPALFDRGVEGEVVLRLFIDSTGRVVAESTKVGESSGSRSLDSAALDGAKLLRYAPAKRRGVPITTWFLQPVEFRQPQGPALGNEPDTVTPRPKAAPTPPVRRARRVDTTATPRRDTIPDTTRDTTTQKTDTSAAPR